MLLSIPNIQIFIYPSDVNVCHVTRIAPCEREKAIFIEVSVHNLGSENSWPWKSVTKILQSQIFKNQIRALGHFACTSTYLFDIPKKWFDQQIPT